MALSPLGVLDLSVVTDRLVDMIRAYRNTAPFGPTVPMMVTGSMPESVRQDGGCQVSVYLFHIAPNKFQRNTPVTGARAAPIPTQPLSLDLYYLITAFADKDYVQEQQAMSVVLHCFHDNPIVRADVVLPDTQPQTIREEFTLTMEIETADELGRLWQAVTVPFRLSAVFKVSVVFMTPPAPAPLALPVTRLGLAAHPTALPYAQQGQLLGTTRHVSFASLRSTTPHPDMVNYDLSPATVAPGQRLLLHGAGLSKPTAHRVYLLIPGAPEQEVTAWVVPIPNPNPPPATLLSDWRTTLQLPSTVGTPPANTPSPGLYQVCVGSDTAAGDSITYRSNATPFSIAARIEVTTAPADPPILQPPYIINGVGLVSGQTEVLLDTIALAETGAPPNPGEFQISNAGSTISLQLPNALAPGHYAVRVRVNQVESDPSWWIIV